MAENIKENAGQLGRFKRAERGRTGAKQIKRGQEIPIAVLVNRFSASASEIFAGAIQDYGRGLIIGDAHTFGKGTVQSLQALDKGQLKITLAKFYRISGESTQHRGVQPDITLPSAINLEDIGESSMESALPWDQIKTTKFNKYSDLKSNIGIISNEINAEHTQRVAQNPSYQYLLQNIAAYETLRSEKAISLNLKARQQQRETLDKARLERANARNRSLGKPVYENLEALEKQENQEAQKKDDTSDALLLETVEITADFNQRWNSILSNRLANTAKAH